MQYTGPLEQFSVQVWKQNGGFELEHQFLLDPDWMGHPGSLMTRDVLLRQEGAASWGAAEHPMVMVKSSRLKHQLVTVASNFDGSPDSAKGFSETEKQLLSKL